MFEKLKKFFTPNRVLEQREREERLRIDEGLREEREKEKREYYFNWAAKHITRWGVWKYRYVFLVNNPDKDHSDESTWYKPVYSNGKMGVPNGMLYYFHISELFPWKSDEEYYRDLEEYENNR